MTDYIYYGNNQSAIVGGVGAKEDVCSMVASVFALAGARYQHSDGYPGWTPNPSSPVMKVAKETYNELFDVDPKVLAIHAGLECGVIGEKYPGMDMISFGPTIKGSTFAR
jgi:dipeptidase D